MRFSRLLLLLCLSGATAFCAEFDPFEKRRWEFNAQGGIRDSPVVCRMMEGRPRLTYGEFGINIGRMLTSPSAPWGQAGLRGNVELLGNAFGAYSFDGPEGFLGGVRVLLRYNFVQPRAQLVPFLQGGVGILGTNIYRDRSQRIIGSGFEFCESVGIGTRWFFTPRCAAILTIEFEHISNAGITRRNWGINSLGGTAGMAWFF